MWVSDSELFNYENYISLLDIEIRLTKKLKKLKKNSILGRFQQFETILENHLQKIIIRFNFPNKKTSFPDYSSLFLKYHPNISENYPYLTSDSLSQARRSQNLNKSP